MKPKLLIIGHAQHGKDTAANYLRDFHGFRVADSSRRAAEIFLFDKLRAKYGYADFEECYQDRVNHRAEWYSEIQAFNAEDRTRLARNILSDSDVYVGMRCPNEIKACVDAGLFKHVVWVDAQQRMPPEPKSSFAIDESIADIWIDNNQSETFMFMLLDMFVMTL